MIPAEVIANLQAAARRAASGAHDAEEIRKACENMDRIREQVYREQGILDIGIPAIRELRDS